MAVIIIFGLIALARLVDARIRKHKRGGMSTSDPVALLAQRSYDSYRCRLEASRRLHRLGHWWNAAQFSLPVALIFISIFSLPGDGEGSSLARAVIGVSVLSLVASIVVTFLDYSARAKALSINYRELQSFSVRVETIVQKGVEPSTEALRTLQLEYDHLIDMAENHTSVDHYKYKNLRSSWREKNLPFTLPMFLFICSSAVMIAAVFGMFQWSA